MANPYLPFYPSDWRSDPKVAMLSLEEKGAYIEVMCLMWEMGDESASIPDDDLMIARQIPLNVTRWRRLKARLCEGEYAVLEVVDGRIYQKRLQKERQRFVDRSETNRQAAEARWEAERRKAQEKFEESSKKLPEKFELSEDLIGKNPEEFRPNERENGCERIASGMPSKPSQAKLRGEGTPLPPAEAETDLSEYDLPECRDLSQFRLTQRHYHIAGLIAPDVDVKAETVLMRNAWKKSPPRSSDLNALWLTRINAKQRFIRQDREKAAAVAHEEVKQDKPLTIPDFGTWILPASVAPPRPQEYPPEAVPVSKDGFVQWFKPDRVPPNARRMNVQ